MTSPVITICSSIHRNFIRQKSSMIRGGYSRNPACFCSKDASFDNSFLKDPSYWQQFYQRRGNESFDWFDVDLKLAIRAVQAETKPSARILHLGCGTSAWCELLEDAFPDGVVTHLDYSSAAVDAVRKRLAQRPSSSTPQSILVGDARALPFPNGSFDTVVDKGTLDVFLASGEIDDAACVVSEVARVLSDSEEAAYVMVSGEAPELREPSFKAAAAGLERRWNVSARNVSLEDAQFEAFMYTARPHTSQ